MVSNTIDMAKAYSYLRFSTPEQMKGDSFRRQTALAQEYCARHGLELDTTLSYEDLGVSAFRGKNAEAGKLADFLEAVESGVVPKGSYLLVESLDRVSRTTPRKAVRILERIVESGVNVVTLSDGKVYNEDNLDNDGGMSLIMSVLIFIRANEESVMKSRRIKAAWDAARQKAKQGRPITKKGPFWLKLVDGKWEVLQDRADTVRQIFAWAAQGVGRYTIAKRLNESGVPGPSGGIWHPATVSEVLNYPCALGTFIPHVFETRDGKRVRVPQEPIKGYWPAIIDEDLWNKVQAMRASKPPKRGRSPVVQNIFGGMVVCGLCGASMNLVCKNYRRKTLHRALVCVTARTGRGCQYFSVPYSRLEERFVLECDSLLAFAPIKDQGMEERLSFLAATISEVEDQRKAASDGYIKTRDENLLARLMELKAELTRLRKEEQALLVQMENSSGPLVAKRVEQLKQLLRELPLDREKVNGLNRQLFSGVSVNPITGIATFAWHHGGESKLQFQFPMTQEDIARREARVSRARSYHGRFSATQEQPKDAA